MMMQEISFKRTILAKLKFLKNESSAAFLDQQAPKEYIALCCRVRTFREHKLRKEFLKRKNNGTYSRAAIWKK